MQARIAVLRRFQRLLSDQRDQVADLICREAGKPAAEALTTEVLVILDATEFCIRNAHDFLREQPLPHANLAMKTKRGRLLREPFGVIGIISPWNYPFSIAATETLGALVTGNAVVLKPSELTPLIALELQRLLVAAGLSPDLMQVVIGEGPAGAALIDSPIDKLIFTGSVATGKRVAEAAARKLLPVVLELGGKDPMIVLDDADLDIASSGALWGAFMNAGQTCLSVERCYVHRSLYEKFLDACSTKIAKLRVGNGIGSEVEIGPLIHERQLRTVDEHVQDAVLHGARLLQGGKRLSELGPNFYAPTLLADVTPDMRIIREETFGPVLPVAPFDTDDEAIRLANDSDFGLAASVWTTNRGRGESHGKADQGRHRDDQRRHLVFWHRRGAARRVQAQRHRAHSRQDGPGRDGAGEVRGHRPASRHEESLVVRIRAKVPPADERLHRCAVCRELGEKTEGRPALGGPAAARNRI